MTAINVIVRPTEVSIVTDTRATSAVGHPFEVPKVMPIPHMRLAVATRGKMDHLTKVVGAICSAAFDFDSARAFLGDHYSELGFQDVEIVVAGWGAHGPAAFIISTTNTAGNIQDIGYLSVTPTVSDAAFDRYTADPLRGMREMLQTQHEGNSAVGGFVNVTQVGPAVIETYTAGFITETRRWAKAA